ncbi:hypothetical protein JCM10212_007116 [Sporobolomyces blumeae]
MAGSPFKRRPTLSKTYGKRASLGSTSRSTPAAGVNPRKSDTARLMLDSDEGADGYSDDDVQAMLVDHRRNKGEASGKAVQGARRMSAADPGPLRRTAAGDMSAEQKRTSVAGRPARRSLTKPGTESDDAVPEDTTNWDEPTAAISSRSSSRRSRRGQGAADESVNRSFAEPAPAAPGPAPTLPSPGSKRARLSRSSTRTSTPVADTPLTAGVEVSPLVVAAERPLAPGTAQIEDYEEPSSPPGRKRPRRSLAQRRAPFTRDETPSHVTAATPYDPPPKASTTDPSADLSDSSLTSLDDDDDDDDDEDQFPVTLVATDLKGDDGLKEGNAPTIRTILPSSSSPAKARPPAARNGSGPVGPPTPRRSLATPTLVARPASPAKDLSSLFSSFVQPSSRTHDRLDGLSPGIGSEHARGSMKRTSSGGVVAAMATRSGSESASFERRKRAVTPVSPRSRIGLDRSFSQSANGSPVRSPSANSPFHSPQRPSLFATSSLPNILSPLGSRSRSPSPSKPNLAVTTYGSSRPSLQGPALGSAYRPVSFSASTQINGSLPENGRTRTYGGARSFRRDVDEDGLLKPTGDAAKSFASRAETADPSASTLPTLPPSLSKRVSAPVSQRETYSNLREKWGVAAEEALDATEELESQERGSRVVGTGILRAQGEGKRWNDEMGWVLDGLGEGKGGSAAKASAIELLNKSLDRDWVRRVKSSGMAERIYLALRRSGAGDGDRVLDISLVVLIAAFARDQRLCEPLFRISPSDVASTSTSTSSPPASVSSSPMKAEPVGSERQCDLLLTLTRFTKYDWATDEIGGPEQSGSSTATKGRKLGKSDARHVASLRKIIEDSDFSPGSDVEVTLRALVLHSLRATASFTPRPIFQPQELLCSTGAFAAVADALLDETQSLRARINTFRSEAPLLPPVGSHRHRKLSPWSIEECLAIFEATSAATPRAYHLVSTVEYLAPLAERLVCLVNFCTLRIPSSDSESSSKLLLSALGIVFGLSAEPAWGLALVQALANDDIGLVSSLAQILLDSRPLPPEKGQVGADRQANSEAVVEENGHEEQVPRTSDWDLVCLVLGIATNLLESSLPETQETLRKTELGLSCSRKDRCSRACDCRPRVSFLTILARLYLDPLDDAPNGVYRTSIHGFLRLLLGLAVVDDPLNEALVLDVLASAPSTAPAAAILQALEEFAKLHDEQNRARGLLGIEPDEETYPDLAPDSLAGGDHRRPESGTPSAPHRDAHEAADDDLELLSPCLDRDFRDLPHRIHDTVLRLKRKLAG